VPHGVGPPIRHKNPNFERNDGSSERLGERHADQRAASMRTLFSACISRFSLCFRYSVGLVKIELTRAAPTSLYVSPSQFVNRVAGPGFVAIVPPKTLLLVKAISDGKAIVVDCPSRAAMGLAESEKHGAGRSAYHGGASEAYRLVNRCAVRSAWRVPSAMICAGRSGPAASRNISKSTPVIRGRVTSALFCRIRIAA
jgi:hypothetical protein